MELDWRPEVPGHIASLVPYPPGKPIEETRREYGVEEVVKLASNENPLGPSPKALAAIRERLPELQLYPDGGHHELKMALAGKLGVETSELAIGNGSNEFIDLLLRVFVAKHRNLVTHRAAFVIYKLCAQLQGCGCIEAPVDADFKPSVDALLAAVNADTRMVMLANPNNPTGAFLGGAEIDRLATELGRRQVLLALDYAYWEYVTDPDLPDPLRVFRKHPHVIILKTFSKIHGLAGARVGYLLARKQLVASIERARQPFNVSSLALAGARAALGDEEHVARSVALNRASLKALTDFLGSRRIRHYPSQGNFVLADFERPSRELHPEFLKRGVIIRPVENYGLLTCFRISCGLPEGNQKLFDAIDGIVCGAKS